MKKSDSVLAVVHQTAKGLFEAGVMDAKTMRQFDQLGIPRLKEYSPAQIQRLRRQLQVSQTVFAAYLNTSRSTVQKWEQGQQKPTGLALKLLNLVERKGLEVLF
jgi:putative transcriptional regulator